MDLCVKCNKEIEFSPINACNKTFHLECFLCTSCGNPMSTRRYKEKGGMPYCSLSCAGPVVESDRICFRCNTPITGSCMKAFDPEKTFHPKCFCCSTCGQCVAIKTFYAKEPDVFCTECYKKELDAAFN